MSSTKRNTQNERLLNHLLRGWKITPLESWKTMGIYRLASRIHELRNGYLNNIAYVIVSRKKEVSNIFGETCHISEYYIEPDDIRVYRKYQRKANA